MTSKLFKWKDGKWRENQSDNYALSGEIIYAAGNENIEASAAEDACRLILFYDSKKEKAAILHTNDMNGTEYIDQISAIRIRKFNPLTTEVYLCGDECDDEYKGWNDDIESFISKLGYPVTRVTKGPGKNIVVNPGIDSLQVTDDNQTNLV